MESLDELVEKTIVPGSLSVVGARTGIGKSLFARTIAQKFELPSVIYIDYEATEEKDINFFTWEREENWFLFEKKDLFIIDTIQGEPGTEQVEKLHAKLKKLKALAQETQTAILITSQLSRINRQGFRPILTDLRETGWLEELPDTVILLHRRDYYDPFDKPGVMEVIVGKNRINGDTSIFHMSFDKYKYSLNTFVPPEKTTWDKGNDDAFDIFKPEIDPFTPVKFDEKTGKLVPLNGFEGEDLRRQKRSF